MNLKEAFQLLTLASARDGRAVDQEVAIVWADDLAHVTLPDAVEAARLHYRESTGWMMPNHVIQNVRVLRDRRDAEARRRRQIESSVRPGTCSVHAEYPLPCDRCAE